MLFLRRPDFLIFKRLMALTLSPTELRSVRTTSASMMARRHCKHPRYHRKSKESCRSHEWLWLLCTKFFVNFHQQYGWLLSDHKTVTQPLRKLVRPGSSRLSDFKQRWLVTIFHESTVLFHQLLYILPQGYWSLLGLRSQLVHDPCCWFPNDVRIHFAPAQVLAVGFYEAELFKKGFFFC